MILKNLEGCEVKLHEQYGKQRTGIITDYIRSKGQDWFVILWDEDEDWYYDADDKKCVIPFHPVDKVTSKELFNEEWYTIYDEEDETKNY